MSNYYDVMITFQETEGGSIQQGHTSVTTDEPIGSLQAIKEVSAEIGRLHGYYSVYINTTDPAIENLDKILDEVKTNAFGQVVESPDAV